MSVSRRAFVGKAVKAAGAFLGFSVLRRVNMAWAAPLATATKTMKYRKFGTRTGLTVSEIGFGGFPIRDPDVLRYAIDRGITYVDTSDDYRGGDSEKVIGEVMATRRKDVVLATKWHPWSTTKKAEMLAVLDGCLKRLRTDHLDLIQVHQIGNASGGGDGDGGGDAKDRIRNPELFAAFAAAKKAGKARFLGATGHDGDLMGIMHEVVDSGHFDTILCRFNFLDYPEQPALFAKAAKAGMGVACMKTLAGARKQDLKPFEKDGASFAQAALRWTLSNKDLGTALISIASTGQVDEYAGASGKPISQSERELLHAYAARHSKDYCRLCNACEPACPHELPVADLLRARMYLESYNDPEKAEGLWAAATAKASPSLCASCPAPCLAACEFGVPIKRKLVSALARLG